MGRKKTDKIVFENITVLDAGAKGVSVAKAPDGKVIFIPNVVPVMLLIFKRLKNEKHTTKEKQSGFISIQNIVLKLFVSILVFVADANGKIWVMTDNYSIKIKKFITI